MPRLLAAADADDVMSAKDLQVVVSETQESRVEALRQMLDYPLKQRDQGGS
ncbi:MAG: hypothetical protein VKL00_10180 [Synechococcales bacterium]|nr:hypothetical protein [Cyanobacteria bacterium REEB444]MEB3125972.1 hypothetical protein [Synechococcales bacterium]